MKFSITAKKLSYALFAIKKNLLTLTLSFFSLVVFFNVTSAQVGIGTSTPSASAKLEIAATDKGFLPPRVALTSTSSSSPISTTPDAGLLIYNTATAGDVTPGYYYWNGTLWKKIVVSTDLNQSVFATDITVNSARVGIGAGNNATNVVVGKTALNANNTGFSNVAVGESALKLNTTGRENVAVGAGALSANTTAWGNVGIGASALSTSITGSANVAVGLNALSSNTTGGGNVGIGYNALSDNTTGSENIGIGNGSAILLTTGTNNTLIGSYTSVNSGSIFNSTAIGSNAAITESNTIKLGNGSISKVITTGQLVSGTVTYPNSSGTAGQVLTTNGSGTASWNNLATTGTVSIGGGDYGITSILGSGNFVADYNNSKLTYMRIGNIVFFNAIIGKFTMNPNHRQEFEFRPPIASSFANAYDAMGTITAYSTNSGNYSSISGSVVANPVYNNTTQSYNLKLCFVVTNATCTDMFVSVSGSYIIR